MTVYELNEEQMWQLKQAYLMKTYDAETRTSPSYAELSDAGILVDDTEIYNEYGGTIFVDEDFYA